MTSIALSERDREAVEIAARLLLALDPGETREQEAERFVNSYRRDLSTDHPSADPDVLDEMAANFCGALLLEMERLSLLHATHDRAGHA